MSIHVAVGLVPVKRFDHKGLHQLQNCYVLYAKLCTQLCQKNLALMIATNLHMSA